MVLETYKLNGLDTIDFVKVHKGGNIKACIITSEGETSYSLNQREFRDILVILYGALRNPKWDTTTFQQVSEVLSLGFGVNVEIIPYCPETKQNYPQMLFRADYTKDLFVDVPVLEEICGDLLKFVETPISDELDDSTNSTIIEMITRKKVNVCE